MTTWLLIFLNARNQSYLTVADTGYSEAKSAPSVMITTLIIIAAATLTKSLPCYCSKGLTPTNSITKTLNPKITYIYGFPIIHSTLVHLWRTAIEERMLAVEWKKKKKELDSNSVSYTYRLYDLWKVSHSLYWLGRVVVLKYVWCIEQNLVCDSPYRASLSFRSSSRRRVSVSYSSGR